MNRRSFLASAIASPMIEKQHRPLGLPGIAEQLDRGDLTKETVPTPALVVDLDRFEANLSRMADHCRAAGVAFRPHAKTHKCPEIARRQLGSGAVGICVATLAEAESMVAAGIQGVLLTSPLADRWKIQRIVELMRGGADLMVSVGDARQVAQLGEAAQPAGLMVPVLIDVDIGDRRTGVLPGDPAMALAREIDRTKNIRLRGVQAYAGHASHTVGFDERRRVSREAMGKAVETRAQLLRAGFDAQILSGGSTGTYNIDSAIEGVTELQVGSYIFMDIDYRRIGGADSADTYGDFLPSLTVLTSVVSTAHADRVTVDAGTKALDTTTAHRPDAKAPAGLTYHRAGDEFGVITVSDGAPLPRLGDRIEFIVPHCDPTVNLYDRVYAARGNKIESIWPICARRDGPVAG